jgi:hypothetical protein
MKITIPTLAALALTSTIGVACQQKTTTETPDRARAAEQVKATDIDLGRSIDADKQIQDKTRSFKPTDTIYVSVDTKGASPGAPITARFTFQDGQLVHQEQAVIAPDGKEHTEFHLTKADGFPAGQYDVEVKVGSKVMHQTFKVE